MALGHGYQTGEDAIAKKVKALAERLAKLGWAIGIFCDVRAWASMAEMIRTELDSRIKLVADHLGGTFPGEESLPEFKTFLELIIEKRVYVKLSGFEPLYYGHEGGIEVLTPIAKAIIEAGPD
jgi:predicted TIM-barrel fold metal-dependent hydrolase